MFEDQVWSAWYTLALLQGSTKVNNTPSHRLVAWTPPVADFVKVNVDGSS